MNTTSLSDFLNGPLFSALVTLIAVGMGTLAVAAVRLLVKVGRLDAKIEALTQHVENIVNDKDVMRWSTISGAQVHVNPNPTYPGAPT